MFDDQLFQFNLVGNDLNLIRPGYVCTLSRLIQIEKLAEWTYLDQAQIFASQLPFSIFLSIDREFLVRRTRKKGG